MDASSIIKEIENQVIDGDLPTSELELLTLSVGFLKSFYFKQLLGSAGKEISITPEQQHTFQEKHSRLEQLQRRLWEVQRKAIAWRQLKSDMMEQKHNCSSKAMTATTLKSARLGSTFMGHQNHDNLNWRENMDKPQYNPTCGGLILTKEHTCNVIENADFIFIENLKTKDGLKWFWVFIENKDTAEEKLIAHEIKYCPYCGLELENEGLTLEESGLQDHVSKIHQRRRERKQQIKARMAALNPTV